MGTYIHYSLGDADGVKTAFLADLGVFLAWFDPWIAEFPDDFPPGMHGKILDFMERGDDAFCTASRDEAKLIDRIIGDYYWEFCFQENRHPAIDISPAALKAYRYACRLSDVLPAASDKAKDYYDSLFRSRSLARCEGHTHESGIGELRLSWLLPDDVSAFLGELEGFESELDSKDDRGMCMLSILTVLRKAKLKGTSLIVATA